MKTIQEKRHRRAEAPKTEGEKLRRYLQVHGLLPLKDFADVCNINNDLFYKMTTRKNPIPQPYRQTIFETLNLTEDEFQEWQAPEEKGSNHIEKNSPVIENKPDAESKQTLDIEELNQTKLQVVENQTYNYNDKALEAYRELIVELRGQVKDLKGTVKDLKTDLKEAKGKIKDLEIENKELRNK